MSTAVADTPKPITSRKDPRFEVTMYKYVGVENAWTLDFYQSHGGYETAKKVVTTMQPTDVVNVWMKLLLKPSPMTITVYDATQTNSIAPKDLSDMKGTA